MARYIIIYIDTSDMEVELVLGLVMKTNKDYNNKTTDKRNWFGEFTLI
jgi:hypothetical protein